MTKMIPQTKKHSLASDATGKELKTFKVIRNDIGHLYNIKAQNLKEAESILLESCDYHGHTPSAFRLEEVAVNENPEVIETARKFNALIEKKREDERAGKLEARLRALILQLPLNIEGEIKHESGTGWPFIYIKGIRIEPGNVDGFFLVGEHHFTGPEAIKYFESIKGEVVS